MNTGNLKNPNVPTLTNPVGIDLAISQIQGLLASDLNWLEKSFGRAWNMPSQSGGVKTFEPKVYQGNSEYYPVLANDALKSYSFWRVNGARNINDYSPLNNHGEFMLTDPVDLIVWFNMNRIDKTKNYIFKEELLKEVLGVLDGNPNINVLRIWDDRADDVFRGYTLNEHHRDLLMYPFGAFRIETNLRYSFQC